MTSPGGKDAAISALMAGNGVASRQGAQAMLNRIGSRDDHSGNGNGSRRTRREREYLVILGGRVVRRCLTEDRAIVAAAELRLSGAIPRIYRAERVRPWG